MPSRAKANANKQKRGVEFEVHRLRLESKIQRVQYDDRPHKY